MLEDAALLITDLVDSTLLTNQLGDQAMSTLWTAHDRVSRDLLARWQGTEINRSDGFLLRFPTVAEAAGYAVAYHRAIAALPHPLAARAGIHVGPGIERDNQPGDLARGAKLHELAGLAIPMAGRIMAIALPGQTLMTSAARTALGDTALLVTYHGHWRCKGVTEPIELFEVGDELAPQTAPQDGAKAYRVAYRNRQWLPVREVPNSLPAERNSFVGRHGDLHELDERLQRGARLISVTGFGGTGKTRLVQHFGWRSLGDFVGGVWYCDLSNATTLDGLCGAVAQGLDVPLGKTEPVEQLSHAIAGRGPCLVVLDNFEQIVGHASATLGRWLDHAIDARFIVTTRTRLGLDGEEVFDLPPLDNAEAIRLFFDRAMAIQKDFRLTEATVPLLARLVDLLDGLPLAIELAAARVSLLPLQDMLDRMHDRFGLLRSAGGRPSRQSTLRAAFNWSWDLLPPVDRSALAQLSVFDGGFTLRALERIVVVDRTEDVEMIDVLQSLIEKSWVRRVSSERFGLLASVRDYGSAQLDRAGSELRRQTETRHWAYYGSLDERAATADHCVEIENLVVATRRATAACAAAAATDCLERTWYALRLCGPARSAIELADGVRRLADLSPRDRARVEHVAGRAHQHHGETVAAARCFETGLEQVADAAVDADLRVWLLCALGELATSSSNCSRASDLLADATALADRLEQPVLMSVVMNAVGGLEHCRGDGAAAEAAYARALRFAREAGDQRRAAGILGNLGGASHLMKRLDEAQRHYEDALDAARTIGDRRLEGNTLSNLGLLYFDQGDLARAQATLTDALANAKELGYQRLECTVAWNLATVAESRQDFAEALIRCQRAYELAGHHGDRRAQGELCGLLGTITARLSGMIRATPYFVLGEKLLSALADDERLDALRRRRRDAATSACNNN